MSDYPELHREPDAAAEMAVNAVLKYLHECDIEGEQEKRRWLQSVFDRVIAKELTH